ncbi:endonuclease domain-containing 1 protein-like [Myxocyprinus asiaticus]|uniref:endonuclease domain-containing 1 protein-like n=1 Tax=Myxocyprinus asiaticus TaxID=70543 RepID=UPI002221ADF9|nr:endonuclease domain-containing 1 protein-like [Myxocyprinus asiaticus]
MMVLIILSAVLMLAFQCAVSYVVDDFSKCSEFFLDSQSPHIPAVLEGGKSQNQNRYKIICQGANKVYTFATLYNTTSRIPVFSAYKYSGKGKFSRKVRKQHWKIEPQLQQNEQATNEDYSEENREKMNVNRGHLFPVCHAKDVTTAESTFILTNAVPQKVSFNNGSWAHMEQCTKQLMDKHCLDTNNKVSAYVLTGAVPGNNKLNNRVNIPSMMWMAFCCCDSKKNCFSKAHWAPNEDDENKNKIQMKSLKELQDYLKNTLGKELKLFNDKCLTDKSVKTNLPPMCKV